MPHDAFISHSSRDEAVAQTVCPALESRGIVRWMAPPIAGRPYTILADGQAAPAWLSVDAASVYRANNGGTSVLRVTPKQVELLSVR